mmetsp:Transcript_13720/g.32257  ORF Transcript_13720/g.32257 Transcript_13720/m.32257 type:complete len:236 (+) Transcript_13720:267-974(+)
MRQCRSSGMRRYSMMRRVRDHHGSHQQGLSSPPGGSFSGCATLATRASPSLGSARSAMVATLAAAGPRSAAAAASAITTRVTTTMLARSALTAPRAAAEPLSRAPPAPRATSATSTWTTARGALGERWCRTRPDQRATHASSAAGDTTMLVTFSSAKLLPSRYLAPAQWTAMLEAASTSSLLFQSGLETDGTQGLCGPSARAAEAPRRLGSSSATLTKCPPASSGLTTRTHSGVQ